MRLLRISADERGESRFADAELPLPGVRLFAEVPPFSLTSFACPGTIKLFAVPAELHVFDFHTAPVRQLAVTLTGTVEYETSDGETRRVGPGDFVLVEDTWGRGHITRFDDGEQYFLFIPVPDDWARA